MSFIPVTSIINFKPVQMEIGQKIKLESTAVPSNATNQTITYSIVSGNGMIVREPDGDYIVPHGTGVIKIRQTIFDGKAS